MVMRSPYAEMPITLVYKSVKQKAFRNLYCMECGLPIAQISDKVVMAYDGTPDMQRHDPDRYGYVEIRCDRHACKQRYRMEFAR